MEHLRLTEFRMFNDTSLPKFFKKNFKNFYRSDSIPEYLDTDKTYLQNPTMNSDMDVKCLANSDVIDNFT